MPKRRGHTLFRGAIAVSVAFVGLQFVGTIVFFALVPRLGDVDLGLGMLWTTVICLALSFLWVFVLVGVQERRGRVPGRRRSGRPREMEREPHQSSRVDSRPRF
ncbi:MAG: hypothetical protein ACYTGV_05095 [Planctomycetota bacterium]|jgi:hypothetical protein